MYIFLIKHVDFRVLFWKYLRLWKFLTKSQKMFYAEFFFLIFLGFYWLKFIIFYWKFVRNIYPSLTFSARGKHNLVIFNKLLIFSCYSVHFGFYIFIVTQNLRDEGRARYSNSWKRIEKALLSFPLGIFSCWLELNASCQECHWCSRETAPLEGAQREKPFWAVPAAHRSCQPVNSTLVP